MKKYKFAFPSSSTCDMDLSRFVIGSSHKPFCHYYQCFCREVKSLFRFLRMHDLEWQLVRASLVSVNGKNYYVVLKVRIFAELKKLIM